MKKARTHINTSASMLHAGTPRNEKHNDNRANNQKRCVTNQGE